MYEVFLFFKNLELNWSWIESIAVFFSILYVILASKESIWCWAAAVISVSLYIYICFSAQLYAETGLQIFYLFMAFYGYYNWNNQKGSLQISEWNISTHLLIVFIGGLLTFLIGFYFATYTNAKMPIVDSFTTVFSVFATYMVTKKILGNWLYWIVIDLVSSYLYLSRSLEMTALLFMIYTIIAILGYLSWIKKINA